MSLIKDGSKVEKQGLAPLPSLRILCVYMRKKKEKLKLKNTKNIF